jgi:hypothetical protein
LRHIIGQMRVDPRLPARDTVHDRDMPPHQLAKRPLGAIGRVGAQELVVGHGHGFCPSFRSRANRTGNRRGRAHRGSAIEETNPELHH